MDGVFWHEEIGFVVDKQKLPSKFTDGIAFGPLDFERLLAERPHFPDVTPAPMASWLLARLMLLTREGLGFAAHDELWNDGGGYYLDFIAFSRQFIPLAIFYIHGHSSGVSAWGTCAATTNFEALLHSFATALLAAPMELMPCRLTYVDTDPPDLHRQRTGKHQLLGWDGERFLGTRHAR